MAVAAGIETQNNLNFGFDIPSLEINQDYRQSFDREYRVREDFVTWAAEALDGQMRTPTSYRYDVSSNELHAEDGSALGAIFDDALVHADELIKSQPQLAFEKRRRAHELDEYHEMLELMQGDGPNTMIVVSDFPHELMHYPVDVGGYNVRRRQTFLRVIRRDGDTLEMYSQTLDGSNRAALEALYDHFGEDAKPGELLGQRMHMQSDKTADKLTEELVGVYDRTLHKNDGGIYFAGREVVENKQNTYEFVLQQTDIVKHAVQEVLRGTINDQSMYNFAALLSQRYNNQQFSVPTAEMIHSSDTYSGRDNMLTGPLVVQHTLLSEALTSAGHAAAAAGQTFSGCGSSFGAGVDSGEKSILEALGFGSKSSSEESYSFNAYRFCVSCQAPPKEKEKKKMCGPCGLCRGCDKKAGGKG